VSLSQACTIRTHQAIYRWPSEERSLWPRPGAVAHLSLIDRFHTISDFRREVFFAKIRTTCAIGTGRVVWIDRGGWPDRCGSCRDGRAPDDGHSAPRVLIAWSRCSSRGSAVQLPAQQTCEGHRGHRQRTATGLRRIWVRDTWSADQHSADHVVSDMLRAMEILQEEGSHAPAVTFLRRTCNRICRDKVTTALTTASATTGAVLTRVRFVGCRNVCAPLPGVATGHGGCGFSLCS
jgi:hypothetical protein